MRIGFAGTHGTGKTTLLKMLKNEYPNFGYATETARDCPYPINEKTDFKSQDWILREEIKRELGIPINDITICDRTTYDQLAYSWYSYENGNMSDEQFNLLKKYATNWALNYDLIFYVPIEFPMEDDGIRSLNEEYRKDIDGRIEKLLKTFKNEESVIRLTGTVEERVAKVKETIFKLVDEHPELVK